MGPKTTPSLISKGGYQIPPSSVGGNRHPLGNRVNQKSSIGVLFTADYRDLEGSFLKGVCQKIVCNNLRKYIHIE